MRRLLFAGLSAVALLSTGAMAAASAAPLGETLHHAQARPAVTAQHVDYRWHGRPYHHRRWFHHHWTYY